MGNLEQVNRGDAARGAPDQRPPRRRRRAESLHADLSPRSTIETLLIFRAAIRRAFGYPERVGPEHAEPDLVEGEPITGGKPAVRRAPISRRPGAIPGAGSNHPGFVHPADAIAPEQLGEARDVVFVRVREHQDVDPAIPRWRPAPSSARTSRPGSGPPSTTIRPPRPPSTRMPSPCPTSSTTTRTMPSGRCATTSASPTVAATSATAAMRGARALLPTPRSRRRARGPAPGPLAEVAPRAASPGDRPNGRPPRSARARPRHRSIPRRLERQARERQAGADADDLTISAYSTQAGRPTRVAMMPGSPAARTCRPQARGHAAAIASGTTGTTRRFTAGATSDRRPNSMSTIGVVAAWAANETPRISATHRRGRPGRTGEPCGQAAPPGEDPGCREDREAEARVVDVGGIDEQEHGAGPAQCRRCGPGLPSSRASRATPAIAPARTTEGVGPTNAT